MPALPGEFALRVKSLWFNLSRQGGSVEGWPAWGEKLVVLSSEVICLAANY